MFENYEIKPAQIKAAKIPDSFTGIQGLAKELPDCKITTDMRDTPKVFIRTEKGVVQAVVGDYLAIRADGALKVYSPEDFEAKYQPEG